MSEYNLQAVQKINTETFANIIIIIIKEHVMDQIFSATFAI